MPGILCEHCTGFCCRYIALPIETPTERGEFEDIRWYLLHEGISVFVEGGDWYLNVATNCRHLQPDFRCGIYETRPRICRDYSTDNCDYHSGDYGWEHHFTCPEHLNDYIVEHFEGRDRKKGNRKSAGAGKKAARRKKVAGGVRVKLGKRNPRLTDYAAATVDTRGVPLPILAAIAGFSDPIGANGAGMGEGRRVGSAHHSRVSDDRKSSHNRRVGSARQSPAAESAKPPGGRR